MRDIFYIVGGDTSRAYSVREQAWVTPPEGAPLTTAATEEERIEAMKHHGFPPYHKVSTYRIVRRLEDAGVAGAALAVLDANPVLKARFYALGEISADDPNARALIVQAGANPEEILSPE